MNDKPAVILLVEDDPGHAELVRRSLEESSLAKRLMHVADGQAALDYLYRQAGFSNPEQSPRPGLVLLDLRLPKVDGLKVLQTIKSDPDLSRIPVVILTTSAAETDVANAYYGHANSYLVKPVDFSQFEAMMEALCCYWLRWNQHPC
jgi:CheY-like chemotaxis protein